MQRLPGKLVKRIQKGEFVDMAELLKTTWRLRGGGRNCEEAIAFRGKGSRGGKTKLAALLQHVRSSGGKQVSRQSAQDVSWQTTPRRTAT